MDNEHQQEELRTEIPNESLIEIQKFQCDNKILPSRPARSSKTKALSLICRIGEEEMSQKDGLTSFVGNGETNAELGMKDHLDSEPTSLSSSQYTFMDACYLYNRQIFESLEEHYKSFHQIDLEATKLEGMKKCPKCIRVYRTEASLNRHMTLLKHRPVDTPTDNRKCAICQMTFQYEYSLRKHFGEVHQKIRIFKCSLCDMRFSRNYILRNHVALIHNGETPFKCKTCGKGFPSKSTLNCHNNRAKCSKTLSKEIK